jgi:hypothetical protein
MDTMAFSLATDQKDRFGEGVVDGRRDVVWLDWLERRKYLLYFIEIHNP